MGVIAHKINTGGFMIYSWRYFDEWLNESIGATERESSTKWKRDDDSLTWNLSFVLPGIKKEDVEITADHGWARIKHPNGSLRISLPRDSDHDSLTARLDLGILELSVLESKASGKRIVKIQ